MVHIVKHMIWESGGGDTRGRKAERGEGRRIRERCIEEEVNPN